jgi:uncharacterized protein with FMN-binding domain
MKKSKISITQVVRLIIQVIFFIFLPSLYINTFAGIKELYIAIINQNFSITQLLPQLLSAIVIIPFTIIIGRFFCGWMCAFGAFGDFIYGISKNVFKIKFKMDEDVDKVLKYLKYVVLAFCVVIIWSFNTSAFSTFSAWDAFGMLATVGKIPNFSYVITNLTVGFTLFLLIGIASIFIERFFCRYLCPLGAVFAIISKLKIARIHKERTNCGKCRICTNNCAMGIPLYKTDVVKSGECIDCMKCVKACPRRNVTLKVSEKDVRPLVTSAAVVTAMTGLYYVGNLGMSAAGFDNVQVTASQSLQVNTENLYKDGTYEGSGTGFRGATTTVSVVVKNGSISDITAISYGDDRPYFTRAFSTVKSEIISNQSTDVNAVSGATFSSNGIMEAVENALSNGKITDSSSNTASSVAGSEQTQTDDKQTTNTEQNTTNSENQASNSQVNKPSTQTQPSNNQVNSPSTNSQSTATQAQSASKSTNNTNTSYKDGTYEGSGTGFRGGTTTVSVVVKNGKITDISTESTRDDRPFYERAFSTISAEIISSQSANVNAVSGATFSSNGIMQAVKSALSNAQ